MLNVQSGISKFHYAFLQGDKALGTLDLPDGIPVARNSSLQGVLPQKWQGKIRLTLDGRDYFLEYERFEAKKHMGLRYFLLPGDPPLAIAESVSARLWQLQVGERTLSLQRQSLFRFCYDLSENQVCIGRLRETTGFSLVKRRYALDLPDSVPLPVQGLIFYLAINQFMS